MSETRDNAGETARHDLLTVAGIGVVAYALTNVLHEGVGHGGTCVLAGGRPRIVSSLHFDGDTADLASWANRLIGAGGTLVNIAVGLVMLVLLPHCARLPLRFAISPGYSQSRTCFRAQATSCSRALQASAIGRR
jgi:hypothetical protein